MCTITSYVDFGFATLYSGWFNQQHIKRLAATPAGLDRLCALVAPSLRTVYGNFYDADGDSVTDSGGDTGDSGDEAAPLAALLETPVTPALVRAVVYVLRERCATIADFHTFSSYFFVSPSTPTALTRAPAPPTSSGSVGGVGSGGVERVLYDRLLTPGTDDADTAKFKRKEIACDPLAAAIVESVVERLTPVSEAQFLLGVETAPSVPTSSTATTVSASAVPCDDALGGDAATLPFPRRFANIVEEVMEEYNVSQKRVLFPCRFLLTGVRVGPGVADIMAVIGRERTLQRLSRTDCLVTNE